MIRTQAPSVRMDFSPGNKELRFEGQVRTMRVNTLVII